MSTWRNCTKKFDWSSWQIKADPRSICTRSTRTIILCFRIESKKWPRAFSTKMSFRICRWVAVRSSKIFLTVSSGLYDDYYDLPQVFIDLMQKLNGIIEECFLLTDFVPLNLFMLDCRRINRVLIKLVQEIKEFVTDYFKALNQRDNRR